MSDPAHKLLATDAGEIFLTQTQSGYMGQTYEMVQPALVVIDVATGKTIPELTWSWGTMGLSADQLDESAEVLPGVELVAYRLHATPHIDVAPGYTRTGSGFSSDRVIPRNDYEPPADSRATTEDRRFASSFPTAAGCSFSPLARGSSAARPCPPTGSPRSPT